MKKISTKIHGALDYLVGVCLIAAPWILRLETANTESTLLIVAGAFLLLYSFFTSYELGLIRLIPMQVHLGLDVVSGILLVISPWLFGFADRVFLPHVLVGLFEIVAAIITRPVAMIR